MEINNLKILLMFCSSEKQILLLPVDDNISSFKIDKFENLAIGS
jgi:hypothetical protein